jgi:hypothetical protein
MEGRAEQSNSHQRGQEAEKSGYKKGPRQNITPKDTIPVTHFLQLGPTSHLHHFPMMSLYHDSLKELVH